MADEKLTALTALASLAVEDLLYVVDDPSGTPESKSITAQKILDFVDANFTATEEQVDGTAIYDATFTGTENLDLSTFTALRAVLTGNTTLTASNTPASGESFVRSLTTSSTASETLTLPVSWNVFGTYQANTNLHDIQIEFSNFPTEGLVVKAFINELT